MADKKTLPTARLPFTTLPLFALLLILLLAAWLRLANVQDNPGWYSDEGTHLAIAGALADGEHRYLAVSGPTLLFAKLPLFEGALALLVRCCGRSMVTLRTFTGLLGVASVALLYGGLHSLTLPPSPLRALSALSGNHFPTGRQDKSSAPAAPLSPLRALSALSGNHFPIGRQDRSLALTAALALAITPQAVLYSRFGFSYNLLVPLVLLAFGGLLALAERGSPAGLLLAAGAVGLGLISDLLMGVYVPILLWVAFQERRRLTWRLALAAGLLLALPAAAYAAALLLTAPDAFWFDLTFTLGRLGGAPLGQQVGTLVENVTRLLLQDVWWPAGVIGLLLLPRRLRGMAFLFLLLPILLLGRTEALFSLSAYYTIPLLPFVALGIGSLLRFGAPAVAARLEARMPRPAALALTVALALLLGTPLLVPSVLTARRVGGTMTTAIDPFLVPGPEARAAAAYVNARLAPGELVLASPAVAWLVEGQAADFQMAAAAVGRATPHLPADVPTDRWAFDPRFGRARFVIVDDLWRNWAAVHVPGAREMLNEAAMWPLRLEAESVRVYERPP